jgi:hypothetical protein
LLQVDRVEGEDALPQVYDPVTIAEYWGKRPGSVMTRIAQLLGVAGGFLSHIAWDIATKKVKEVGLGPIFHICCFEGFFSYMSGLLIYQLRHTVHMKA